MFKVLKKISLLLFLGFLTFVLSFNQNKVNKKNAIIDIEKTYADNTAVNIGGSEGGGEGCEGEGGGCEGA